MNETYTMSEVMHLFGVAKETVRGWMWEGKITPISNVPYEEAIFTKEEVQRCAQKKYGGRNEQRTI